MPDARSVLRFLAMALPISAVLLLASCADNRFSAGHPLDDDAWASWEVSDIGTEREWSTFDPYTPTAYPADTAFWPRGGAAYHTNPHCRHLTRADTIYFGTIEEAADAGKTKLCPTCVRERETSPDTEEEHA